MSDRLLRCCALLAAAIVPPVALAQPAAVVKTNSTKVFMHYMPWFETPATLGGTNWGYHWKFNNQNPNTVDETGKRQIASHYYPLIGPYASRDPDVIEYHLLLMKLSGVDGVLIDWYGVQGTNGDINNLLTSSNALVNKTDDFGMDFGVVLEDRFSANIGQAEANVAYLRDNYFNRPEYVRLGDDQNPLLGVFGPIKFQQPSNWTQILDQAGEEVDLLTLWYEGAEAGANASGEYAWIHEDAAQNNHLQHQRNFYLTRAQQLEIAGGVAYPGFDDFYVEGGVGQVVPFDIPHDDGQTLDAMLALATTYASRIDFLQLATFNDYGEGTMFEPTVETGFEYLKKVQQFTGVEYYEEDLRLVYRLFLARKEYAGDAAIQAQLDLVSTSLTELRLDDAAAALAEAAPAGDFDGDGDVDAADYRVWQSNFGVRTVSLGTGADANFDGVVDASDYTIWRDGFQAAHPAEVVPEPTAVTLAGLTALMVTLLRIAR